MTNTVLNTKISEVKNKIPVVGNLVKKESMALKYLKSKESTLLLLIMLNLRVTYLIQ